MAQMPFSPCKPIDPALEGNATSIPECPDTTVNILNDIFGDVVLKIAMGQDPDAAAAPTILAEMFTSFNSGILTLATLVVTYITFMGVLNTAKDGASMGKDWSSMWTVTRLVTGSVALLPAASGYSVIQLLIFTVTMWGVGFANNIYEAGIAASTFSPAEVITQKNEGDDRYGIAAPLAEYAKTRYCMKLIERFYNDSDVRYETGAGGFVSRKYETKKYKYIEYPVRDYSDKKLGGGAGICGSVIWKPAKAPQEKDYSDRIELAKERVATTVSSAKLSITMFTSMPAIALHVNSIPTRENDAGWDQLRPTIKKIGGEIKKSQVTLAQNISSAVTTSTIDAQEAGINNNLKQYTKVITYRGWANAGGWFQKVSAVRNELRNVINRDVLEITAPNLALLPDDARKQEVIRLYTVVSNIMDRNLGYGAVSGELDAVAIMDNSDESMAMVNIALDIPTGGIDSDMLDSEAIVNSMNQRMTSWTNRFMAGLIDIALGANNNKVTDNTVGRFVCGETPSLGGAMHRIKCMGDVLVDAYAVIQAAKATLRVARYATKTGSSLAENVPFVGGTIKEAIVGLFELIEDMVVDVLNVLLTYIQPLAFYFGVALPSMPYVIFMIVVVAWVLSVLQSIVAAPLWIIMHMTPERSFIGGQKQGYLLILSVFARPALAVIGLFAGLLVFDPIMTFIANAFFSMRGAISNVGSSNIVIEIVTFFWWMAVFGAVLLPVVYMIFGLSQTLPGHVLKWIGGGIDDFGESSAIANARTGITSAQKTPMIGGVDLPDRSGSGQQSPNSPQGGGDGGGAAPSMPTRDQATPAGLVQQGVGGDSGRDGYSDSGLAGTSGADGEDSASEEAWKGKAEDMSQSPYDGPDAPVKSTAPRGSYRSDISTPMASKGVVNSDDGGASGQLGGDDAAQKQTAAQKVDAPKSSDGVNRVSGSDGQSDAPVKQDASQESKKVDAEANSRSKKVGDDPHAAPTDKRVAHGNAGDVEQSQSPDKDSTKRTAAQQVDTPKSSGGKGRRAVGSSATPENATTVQVTGDDGDSGQFGGDDVAQKQTAAQQVDVSGANKASPRDRNVGSDSPGNSSMPDIDQSNESNQAMAGNQGRDDAKGAQDVSVNVQNDHITTVDTQGGDGGDFVDASKSISDNDLTISGGTGGGGEQARGAGVSAPPQQGATASPPTGGVAKPLSSPDGSGLFDDFVNNDAPPEDGQPSNDEGESA